jgi:hypothetical protein
MAKGRGIKAEGRRQKTKGKGKRQKGKGCYQVVAAVRSALIHLVTAITVGRMG